MEAESFRHIREPGRGLLQIVEVNIGEPDALRRRRLNPEFQLLHRLRQQACRCEGTVPSATCQGISHQSPREPINRSAGRVALEGRERVDP